MRRSTRGRADPDDPGRAALVLAPGDPDGADLRAVFRLAYRQTEGLIGSIIGLLGLTLRVLDHTTPQPPRATAVPSETAESEPTQRDRHLQHIAEHGRMAWQKASGYTKRTRAEAAIGGWKQVIGDRLRAHTDELVLGRPRWTSPSTCSIACWTWDARATSGLA